LTKRLVARRSISAALCCSSPSANVDSATRGCLKVASPNQLQCCKRPKVRQPEGHRWRTTT
jgi:hypothetical protein